MDEVVKELQAQADKKQIKVVTEVQEMDKFLFDPQLVREIYMNLVSNAIKYTPQAGLVKVLVALEDDQVVSRVIDDGMGIPKEEQSQIFSRFYRAQNAVELEEEGTGLGLSVAKMMVEKCAGNISFKSPVQPDKTAEGRGGTEFIFTLPYALT